jgi:hypothetical protein
MPNESDTRIIKPPEAGYDGSIVREHPVSVEFLKIRQDQIDVIESVGTARVSSQLGYLPWSQR